jgi:hypothetical protein
MSIMKNHMTWIITALATIIILCLLVFYYCKKEETLIEESRIVYDKTINEIFRTLLETDTTFKDVSVVLGETIPLAHAELDVAQKITPYDTVYMTIENDYDRWVKRHIKNSDEANFMILSIEPLKKIIIDSALIHKPVLSVEEHIELFQNDKYGYGGGYGVIHEKYGKGYYVNFSTPVFNEDSTKVLLTAGMMLAHLNGFGLMIILEKINNTWQVIYKKETWIS